MSGSEKATRRKASPTLMPQAMDGHRDEPAASSTGKRAEWIVEDDLLLYSGTRIGDILPTLWQATREYGWATTDGGTIFHIPTPLPWHSDSERWTSPEHRALFAALSWAWAHAEAGHCRHGLMDGPRFVLSFHTVSRGQDPASGTCHALVGGHDRQRQRAFLDWRGERAVICSPQHLLALVADALGSKEITLRMAVLPDGLRIHLNSHPPDWPWSPISHHDLAILGRKECEDCLGLGYTVDDAQRTEERIVRPCLDCCERLLAFNFEESDEDPWPCVNDAAFERYTALRRRLITGKPVKKGKAGRKPSKIRLTVSFSTMRPEEAERRWTKIQEIITRAEARQREAERIQEEMHEAPRPQITVDTTALLTDFFQVAALSGVALQKGDIEVEVLPAPHRRPKQFPPGKQVVYVFLTAWDCLKVGRVGPNSEARYVSQDYSHRATNSTLGRSLLGCDAVVKARLLAGALPEPTEEGIGAWVEEYTTRINFLIPSDQPSAIPTLLEAFLRSRLKPILE